MVSTLRIRAFKLFVFAFVLLFLLTACGGNVEGGQVQQNQGNGAEVVPPTATARLEPPTDELADDQAPTPTTEPAAEEPAPTPTPAAINPLTGLPVSNADSLCVPPVLVSISNFPPSARPQSGLAFASQVWETYIGEGMTRFLAVYYGQYSDDIEAALENRLAEGSLEGFVIGPVRSGRVVFEDIKTLFPKGWLVTAGASAEVKAQLTNRSSVYGSDPEDINSAGLDPNDLPGGELCSVDPSNYGDLVFSEQPAPGGTSTEFFRIVYNLYNQIGWTWDQDQGAYLRSQDQADGSGELQPALEALTGDQLAFENVMVIWAQHRYVSPTILEMELVYVRDRYGLLFRDGQVFEVQWSTPGGKMLVHDAEGDPIPLDKGRTFIEVVSYETTWDPEAKVIRYHNPPLNP